MMAIRAFLLATVSCLCAGEENIPLIRQVEFIIKSYNTALSCLFSEM